MPFTFSHPALTLPLTYLPKKLYSLTGLIIGSMTPDFEYFIRMKIQSDYGHTLAGMFYFDLPIGILIAFIFHNLIRDSLYNNLPSFLQIRLKGFQDFKWNNFFIKNWLVISISIIVGASSHILWDSFTHKFGYFVETLPNLSNRINLLGHSFPLYKILQHSSTLIGGLIILYAFFKLPVNSVSIFSIDLRYWVVAILLSALILVIRFLTGLDIRLIGQVIVTIISAIMISLTVTPLLIRKKLNCL
jgi:hypothetical protein